MALDGKPVIKEEILDKDNLDSASSYRRTTKNKETCRTPDSPESARAVAPRSPMSPQIHQHSSLAPPRPNRNASSSPVINGATTTPPPATSAITPHFEQSRALSKIRKFLGSLVQFAQDTHPEASDRIRALVLSLVSGGITIEEFRIGVQEASNYPLRAHVVSFLKTHIPLLQREISGSARATNQTSLQYVTQNDSSVMEFSHGSTVDHSEIFIPFETATNPSGTSSNINSNALLFKRRASDTLGDHQMHEWSDYMYPPTKRLSHGPSLMSTTGVNIFNNPNQPSLFDYQTGGPSITTHNEGFSVLLDKPNHREERDIRCSSDNQRMNRISGEEEWKNIHTMLNCISGMVDKTKRAIKILEQRGIDPQSSTYSDSPIADIRRQMDEKVSELKRNAEDAVNQVKRQAVIEIQRAVVAAENRAADMMTQERLKMEKFFVEMSKHRPTDRENENKSPSLSTGQNSCWNCGRKANETCSGCNMARYCGAFCQHKDWEHHHQICGNVHTDVTATASKHGTQSIRNQISRSPPSVVASQSSQSTNQQSSTITNGGINTNSGSK